MKICFLTVFLIFCNYHLFSEDISFLKMEIVTTLKEGNGKCELMTQMKSPVENGPTAFAFDKNGNMYISDILNEKLVKFDSFFSCKEEYRDGYAWGARQLLISDSGEFIINNSTTLAVDDSNGKKKAIISLWGSAYQNQIPPNPDFVHINNVVFFRLNSGELVKIEDPGNDSKKNINKSILVKPSESMEQNNNFLNERTQNSNFEIKRIESKEIIINNNMVKTTDFNIFNRYWKNKREEENKQKLRKGESTIPEPDEKNLSIFNDSSTNIFIGKDSDGNYYWDTNTNSIFIFDSEGKLIKYFRYDMDKSMTDPAAHPSGDIYFLNYDEKGVYLYKIARAW